MRRALLVVALVIVAFVTVASVIACATGNPPHNPTIPPAVMIHP